MAAPPPGLNDTSDIVVDGYRRRERASTRSCATRC